jgi:hypothetical protein
MLGKKKGAGEGERSIEEKEKGTFILSEEERDLLYKVRERASMKRHPVRGSRKVEEGRKEIRKEERITEAKRSRGKRDEIFLF